ncbi:MAG: MOSC domain-containing protein [Rhodospirillaceae bacterium]
MTAEIKHIYRYPVKGLTAEPLDAIDLAAGAHLPGDRRFAVALGSTPVSGAQIEWMGKRNFLALVSHEKLATLETGFDHETDILTIKRQGRQVARGKATDRVGRSMIEDFFAAYMKSESRGKPKLVEANPGDRLTDSPEAFISIINLASVRDLERVVKQPVNPMRFRANVCIDGIDPWTEFDWISHDITAGGAVLSVECRIDRCAAVNVNPETAELDLNIIKFLQGGFGHIDVGVFAKVTQAGRIAQGDGVARA